MAYEFKKLSEMELLDSVPTGATVLAEVGGVIRRVPSTGLGGSSATDIEVLPEQTLEGFDVGGLTLSPAPCELVPNKTYIVLWDGVAYACDAQSISIAGGSIAGVVALGDCSSFGAGASSNGEPFMIAYASAEAVESMGNGTEPVLILEANDTESTSHTVRIYQVATPFKLDLVAIGLPAVKTDGSICSVECDTSEIIAALAKDVVRLSCAVESDGFTMIMGGIAGATCASGIYNLCLLGELFSMPVVLSLTIHPGAIYARVMVLSTVNMTGTT